MNTTKFAASALIAGLLLAGYGLATNSSDYQQADGPAALQATGSLQPITGLAPIGDVIDLFQERSDAHPQDYISRTQLGVALNAQARENADLVGYTQAESVLREALALNPRYTAAKLSLASALHSQHQFTQALALATEVADEDPGSLSALALIGDANFELGNYPAARANYNDLATLERSAPTVSRLARLAWVQGDRKAAVSLAAEALELSEGVPQRPNAAAFYWFQLGHFQFKNGQIDDSVASLQTALAVDPESSAAKELLATIFYATGELELAGDLYLDLIESGPAADLYGSYADILVLTGDTTRAVEYETRGATLAAATIDRFPAERRHLVGFFLLRDPQLALELAKADLEDRHDVGAYDTLAWALLHAGEPVAAQDAIDKALAEGTQDPSFLYHAAAIAAANGDADAATGYAQSALAINPFFHPTEVNAARNLVLAVD